MNVIGPRIPLSSGRASPGDAPAAHRREAPVDGSSAVEMECPSGYAYRKDYPLLILAVCFVFNVYCCFKIPSLSTPYTSIKLHSIVFRGCFALRAPIFSTGMCLSVSGQSMALS